MTNIKLFLKIKVYDLRCQHRRIPADNSDLYKTLSNQSFIDFFY